MLLPELELPSSLAAWPPAALAVAPVLLVAVEVAPMLMAPPADRLRVMVAVTVSVAVVSAREAPTATLPPWVWPVAVVATVLVWVALPVKSPPRLRSSPLPRRAVVVSTSTDTAAVGVTDTVEPAEPPVTVVVMVWSAMAFKVSPPALFRIAPSSTSARVVSTATFRPTEAPTPTAAGVFPLAGATDASAVAVLLEVFSASSRTAPPPALTLPVEALFGSPCR